MHPYTIKTKRSAEIPSRHRHRGYDMYDALKRAVNFFKAKVNGWRSYSKRAYKVIYQLLLVNVYLNFAI